MTMIPMITIPSPSNNINIPRGDHVSGCRVGVGDPEGAGEAVGPVTPPLAVPVCPERVGMAVGIGVNDIDGENELDALNVSDWLNGLDWVNELDWVKVWESVKMDD